MKVTAEFREVSEYDSINVSGVYMDNVIPNLLWEK